MYPLLVLVGWSVGGTQHTQQGEREREGEREIWEIGRDGGGTGCLSLVSFVCAHTHTSSTPVPHDSVIFLTLFTRSVPAVCVVTRDTHLSLSLSLSLALALALTLTLTLTIYILPGCRLYLRSLASLWRNASTRFVRFPAEDVVSVCDNILSIEKGITPRLLVPWLTRVINPLIEEVKLIREPVGLIHMC